MLSSRLRNFSFAWRTGCTVAVAAAMFSFAFCTLSQADTVLLDDSWSDGSRTETNLPNESAVYASHDTGVTMAVGSLTYDQTVASSERLATYFTSSTGQSVDVGNRLCVSVDFTPSTAIYPSTSRNFRMGLFHDPDDERVSADGFNDSGGGIWDNAEGYAVQMPITLSSTPPNPFNIVKRVGGSTSLLGSNSANFQTSSGGDPVTAVLDKDYRIVAELRRSGTDEMKIFFSLYDIDDIGNPILLSTHHVIDTATTFDGEAQAGIYSAFDLLAFRFSDSSGTADDLIFKNFKVQLKSLPEPASMMLLGLGSLAMLLWRRRR